jgi:hypothetical protein
MQKKLSDARRLFQSLKLHISDYFENAMARKPNYEDVYYLADEMYKGLSLDTENLVAMDWLCDRLAAKNVPPLSKYRADNRDVLRECCNLIRDVVSESLKKDSNSLDYLNNLFDQLLTSSDLHLFSLNHDSVLDRYLIKRGCSYSDGFAQRPEKGVRYWNPRVFDRSARKVRLYKLHGAIDWFRFRRESSQSEPERVGIPVNGEFWHTFASDGQRQWPVDQRPAFLAGTFNKITDYTDDVFIELHYRFMSCLQRSKFLVVCGYGFGDKGINGRVLSWLLGRDDRKMIVIHGNPSQARDRARGAVRGKWDELVRLGRIQVVKSWVQDLKPAALAGLIR